MLYLWSKLNINAIIRLGNYNAWLENSYKNNIIAPYLEGG